jgi:hypothetical protein
MLFRGAALSSLQKQLATATASSSSSSVSSSASVAASVTAAVVVLVTASSHGEGETNGDRYSTITAAFPSPSSLSQWRGGINNNGAALCQGVPNDGAAPKRLDLSAAATTTTATTKGGGGMSKRPYGIDVVLGSQWGDEGKGKLVDILSQVSLLKNGERSGGVESVVLF